MTGLRYDGQRKSDMTLRILHCRTYDTL